MSGTLRPAVHLRAPVPGLTASILMILGAAVLIGLSNRSSGGSSSTAPPSSTELPLATVSATATGAAIVDHSYTLTVEPGLIVEWNAEAAAARVLSLIASNEKRVGRSVSAPRILSVNAMTGKNAPEDVGGDNLAEFPVVWIVHAMGTFTNDYGPVTVEPGGEGWYIFDDAGQVVGSGFTSP